MRHTTLTGTLALPQTSRVSNGSVNDAMASLRDASPFRFTLNCFRIVHHTLSCEGFTALLRMGFSIVLCHGGERLPANTTLNVFAVQPLQRRWRVNVTRVGARPCWNSGSCFEWCFDGAPLCCITHPLRLPKRKRASRTRQDVICAPVRTTPLDQPIGSSSDSEFQPTGMLW